MVTVLSGEHFMIDNRRYYVEFKALIADGPGWSFIKAYDTSQDGRKAILALKAQCEGLSFRLNKKAQAYKKIRELSFSGHRRNWTLQHYITGHLEAHNVLSEMDEAVPETKKVMDLLNGISDPLLRTAKDVCLGDVNKLSSFQTCQQFLMSVASNNRHFSRAERRVSSIRRNNSHRGNNNGAMVTLSNGEKIPLSRIPPAKWNRMSRQDRNTVLQARRASGNRNRNRNISNSGTTATNNTDSGNNQDQRTTAATRQETTNNGRTLQRDEDMDRTVAAFSRVRFGRNAE